MNRLEIVKKLFTQDELIKLHKELTNDLEKSKSKLVKSYLKRIKDQSDPKYINVPNINFSRIDPEDPREVSFSKMRKEMGFDPSELWSLDSTISQFIAPRLRYWMENNPFVHTEKEKKDFKLILDSLENYTIPEVDPNKVDKGLKLLFKYYRRLWS